MAPAPVPIPVASWTGCYVGGHVGGDWSRSRYTFDNGAGLVENFVHEPDSWIAGGQVGCQFQFAGPWVLGAEGTWSATDLKSTDLSVIDPARQRTLKIDQIATVTGKLGYAAGHWMLYGKGGFADGRIETFAINTATGVLGDVRNWQSGWTVGVGVDYMVMPNLLIGGEFNYYNFGFNRTQLATDGSLGVYSNTRSDVYSVMGRASWLFNFGGPVVARY
jgi:outer membrane immunogenic protein